MTENKQEAKLVTSAGTLQFSGTVVTKTFYLTLKSISLGCERSNTISVHNNNLCKSQIEKERRKKLVSYFLVMLLVML